MPFSQQLFLEDYNISIPIRKLLWRSGYRLIFGKRVTEELFDDLVSVEDLNVLKEVVETQNYRRKVEERKVPGAQALNLATGKGCSVLNAPVVYKLAKDGRFAAKGERCGYFSKELKTAIAEVTYHQERRCKTSDKGIPYYLEMRVVKYEKFNGKVFDIKGKQESIPVIYNTENYQDSIKFGQRLRKEDIADGIVYNSVRVKNGNNLALFKRNCENYTEAGFIHLDWDGESIRTWYRVS